MIKIKLSEASPSILVFDGEILEIFFEDGSRRYHVSHIKGFQLTPQGQGKFILDVALKFNHLYLQVDEAASAKVNSAAAEVQRAMSSTKG